MNVVKKVSENIRPESLGAVLCSTDTKSATELGAAVIEAMSEMTPQELAGADALLQAIFGQHFMQAAGAAQEMLLTRSGDNDDILNEMKGRRFSECAIAQEL